MGKGSIYDKKSILSRLSKISTSKISMAQFKKKNEGFPMFTKENFQNFISCFEEDWLKNLSLCKPLYINVDDLGFIEKIKHKINFSNNDEKEGIEIIKKHGYDLILQEISIPNGLLFPIYSFDLRKFIIEERKFVLIIKEVQLLNLLGSVIQGLSLCRSMKLPHGNLSLSTIFKKGKHNWEISPPLYSRINLKNRRIIEDDLVKIGMNAEYAIDYLISPESNESILKIEECRFDYKFNLK